MAKMKNKTKVLRTPTTTTTTTIFKLVGPCEKLSRSKIAKLLLKLNEILLRKFKIPILSLFILRKRPLAPLAAISYYDYDISKGLEG